MARRKLTFPLSMMGTHTIQPEDALPISETVEGERRKEFWEVNCTGIVISIFITVASSAVGLVISGLPGVVGGLRVGLLALFVSTCTKVRDILRFRS